MLRRRRLLAGVTSPAAAELRRAFRSEAALEAIHAHSHPSKDAADSEGPTHLALYHYPTFAGAYAALAAHLFHRRLRRRLLLLPFSSVEPFRVGDFEDGGFQKCYLLDFIGPKNFALELSRFIPRICNLLDQEDEERVFNVLKYIEDADLRQWQLPNSKEFQTALSDERAKLNCITNPLSLARDRLEAAGRLIDRPFKVQLGRGLYGECLAIRADGNSKLSHEIGLELSQRSAAAGLRPIGAVVFMQRGLLKVCLRTTDNTIDTAEIAKAYGGGGKPNSSSFALRLEEFNAWTSVNS
uniref:Uncharacterized protein n=1 Tax=Leersia perrieri TaxID=77586 RepID=A0A0D9XPG2_9ORYZ